MSEVIWTDVRNTLEATLYTGPSEGLEKRTNGMLRQVPTKDCDYTEEHDLFEMSDFSWLQSSLTALVAQTEDGANYRKDYTDLLVRVFNCYTAKVMGKA